MSFGRWLLAFFILICTYNTGYSQFFKKKKKEKEKTDTEAVSFPIQEILKFENVNKVPYYFDEKKRQRIRSLEENKNWEDLYLELDEYIMNFGIQNFYKDTELLWQYAKLTELYGDPEDANFLYRLVLKHHRPDIDLETLEIYYDSISRTEREKYVPIDYYYELVDYRKEVDTIQPPRGVKINMGHLINSNVSDYGPVLSINDHLLLFTSKRNFIPGTISMISNEDIFYSILDDGVWQEASPLKDINSVFNEGSVCLSKDGKTMFFSRCDAPDSYGNCDLFTAELQPDSTWGNISNMGTIVNSKGWDSHPNLNHTEDTLYFASDRIGGFGLSDIYFTYKNKNGEWMPSQNAGPIINTRKNDLSPFYHPVYHVLYFSSDGQLLNFGEFDIYKSNQTDYGWSEPKNIGPLINGAGSEFYFTIDRNSEKLFYARSIENDLNNLDLYSFPLPMEGHPLATTTVTGSLMESETGDPFQRGIVSIIDVTNGIEVAPQYLSKDGTFEFSLINNSQYMLVIQGDEFFRIEEFFFLEDDMEINKIAESISSKMKFSSIEFDKESSDLKPSMYYDLDKLANFLLDNPDFKLRISGHTDSEGSASFNKDLSEQRAQNIMDYITYFGRVPENRVEAFGYGSSQPIVEEKTDKDRALNRRVEFELYRPSKEELEKMYREQKAIEEEEW